MRASDDQGLALCANCGRPMSERLDLWVGVSWLVATGLAIIALVLVIIVAARALW